MAENALFSSAVGESRCADSQMYALLRIQMMFKGS